jgi:SAM-dependent methyltransferase
VAAIQPAPVQRGGWGEKAESYGLLTGRITARFVEMLLDAAGVAAGKRLLDVATGPGYAARRAVERGAVATGVDIADEMVALARRSNGGVRFLRGDAEQLPFPDRAFDAVVCGFGINHIPRPDRALGEFVRVVAPGGGIALSTWDRPERNRFLGILADALRAGGGTPPPETVAGPDHYRFGDDDELRTLLGGAGLEDIDVRSVSLSQRVSDVDELWEGMLGGSVHTAGLVLSQTPSRRQRIRAAVDRLTDEYRVDGGLAIPVRAKIARGRRP